MRRKKVSSFLLALWIFGIISPLWAGDEGSIDTVYFDRSREGWFWYLESKTPPRRGERLSKELPPTMKEMQARAEELLNHAIEAPTETNVVSYMAYQRLLTRRAEQFARTWQRVLWQYPGLDPTVEDPVATAGLSVAQAQQAAKRDVVLSRLARTSGVLYFFSSNCPLCEVQSPILAAFAQTYGFPVVAISLDGSADPVFGVGKIDRGAAKRLGVEKVPALFLARPPSEVQRVGTGLLAMEDLALRLYHLNEGFGETSDEDSDEMAAPVSGDRDTFGDPLDSPGPGRFAATTR